MVARRSAGLLMYRMGPSGPELLLVHPGGPFWAKKDDGAWSIPKGLHDDSEDSLDAAKREFEEETGCKPHGDFIALGAFTQSGGKVVAAWAFEGDCDAESLKSTTFSLEWPRGSGRRQEFPEVDRAGWFGLDEARRKILPAQAALLEELASKTP